MLMPRWTTVLLGLLLAINSSAKAQILPPPADLEQRIRDEVEEWTPWFWQFRETGVLPPAAEDFQFSVLPMKIRTCVITWRTELAGRLLTISG